MTSLISTGRAHFKISQNANWLLAWLLRSPIEKHNKSMHIHFGWHIVHFFRFAPHYHQWIWPIYLRIRNDVIIIFVRCTWFTRAAHFARTTQAGCVCVLRAACCVLGVSLAPSMCWIMIIKKNTQIQNTCTQFNARPRLRQRLYTIRYDTIRFVSFHSVWFCT